MSTLVAMSGGVDSSVSALLLKQQGVDAIGVSMQVWDYRQNGGCSSRATCCAPDDFTDARMVAAKIGIPYYVFDLEDVFRERVIDKFVSTYEAGSTPNPCIDCNNQVKFKELRQRAASIGCDTVATGHFARILRDQSGYHLLRGVDRDKDQSYFLYGMSQSELAKTVFPVGEMSKSQVRQIAKEHGLVTADKPESQDICFISGLTKDFVAKKIDKKTPGDIVTTSGRVLGRHDGIHAFTIGQRRGLGLGEVEAGDGEPLYVVSIDAFSGQVTVGGREQLQRESFEVKELSWCAPKFVESKSRPASFSAIAQLRHRHEGVRVEVVLGEDNSATIRFQDEWSSVAPGQAAVFYDLENQEMLGGGRISNSAWASMTKQASSAIPRYTRLI